jgi:hypothetical protein
MSYEDLKLPTPEIFEGTRPNSKILIISSGHSTSSILAHKETLRKKFDVIIACNYAFEFFDDIIDFHLVTEKTSKDAKNMVYKILGKQAFRGDVPRIINWKGIELYPTGYKYIKATRSNFNFTPNIYKYKHNKQEGFLVGPPGKQNFSLGSVTLSAMHFSAMLGAAEMYLIGADMCFKNQFDHFYNDKIYRERPEGLKKANAHNIVQVNLHGQTYETTEFFKQSAEYIDSVVATLFKDIKIFDFSNGLLTAPIKLNTEEFLRG